MSNDIGNLKDAISDQAKAQAKDNSKFKGKESEVGHPIDEMESNRNGLWASALIVLLGIFLFSMLVISSDQGEAPLINKQAKLHIASANTDNIKTIMRLKEGDWATVHHSNFAVSSNAHWFTVEIPPDKMGQSRLIEISYANLDTVDLWFAMREGSAQEKTKQKDGSQEILQHYKTGDNFAFSEREIQHDQLVFSIPKTPKPLQLYLRVKTEGSIKVPIKLWTENAYIQYTASHRVFIGVFYGFMAAMALINLFLFVSSRNPSTLLYAGYVICLSLTLASSQGLGFRFLWPESIHFQQYSVLFFASLMVFFSTSFTAQLLDIKNNYHKISRFFNAMRIVILLYIALTFVLPFSVMASLLALLVLMAMLLVFSATIYIGLKGNSVAKYLAAAWCSLLFSGVVGLADYLSLISLHLDPSFLLMVGAVIETLFMALGLAMRFNIQRLTAKRSHLTALENKQKAMLAKEKLMRLQVETKEKLEYAVGERTYELEIAIRELNEANYELERKTSIDPLTGVANRRLYDKKVVAEARRSRREKTPLAIAMIDIDHFKAVNDTFGHQCGDEALKHFAKILIECIKRPSDIICRYGGEEFVIILPNTDLAGAKVLMENIRSATENSQVQCDDQTIKFTVSIGVSTRIIATDSEYELLNAFADKLLYKAKKGGRNQVVAAEF